MRLLDALPGAERERDAPKCVGCGKRPAEIDEYVEAAAEAEMSPDDYVCSEEGTFNKRNGHFLCTDCYCLAGMPTTPMGWIAP